MTANLRFELLGGQVITLQGAALNEILPSKAAALLCYLVITGRPHSRQELSGLLWGESSDLNAGRSLRVVLTQLRQQVAPYLTITRQSVAFCRENDYWLDIAEFSQAVHIAIPRKFALAEKPIDYTQDQVAALQTATALYHGDLMTGIYITNAPAYDDWLVREREWLRQSALQVLHRLTAYYLAKRAYSAGIDTANQLLKLEPWEEEAHRQLMLLLAYSGQRSAALAQYETCRRLLERELGVEPTLETRLLARQIEAGLSQVPEPSEPPSTLPAAIAQVTRRLALPTPVTPLIGREKELAHLITLLLDPAHRLVTIVGTGGVGKTRLALAAARQVQQRLADGAVFVPLADTTRDPSSTPQETLARNIIGALGIVMSSIVSPTQQLLDYLYDKEMLLVLDNFDHIQDSANWLSTLLEHSPCLTVLVTSRLRLNLRAEYSVLLSGLSVPDSLADAMAHGSVQLFVERARQTPHGFELGPANVQEVVQICQLTGGLPLGIELAAAWVEQLPLADIARAIEENLDLLTSQMRDTPHRQSSMRAVFDYSWQMLSPEEQASLVRLAIFYGPFDDQAAQAITDTTPVDLNRLAERSLLQRVAPRRYAWHPLLHQFARETMHASTAGVGAAVSSADLHNRHSDYYLSLVARRERQLIGLQAQAAVAEIQHEWQNVLPAWQWAASHVRLPALQRSLNAMTRFLLVRGEYEQARNLLGIAAEGLATLPEPLPLLTRLILAQAHFLSELGHQAQSRNSAQRALALAEAAGDIRMQATARLQWGITLWRQGRYDLAWEQLTTAQRMAEKAQDQLLLARTLDHLGLVASLQEDYVRAGQFLEQSLLLYRQVGDVLGESIVLCDLGGALLQEGQYEAGLARLNRSLRLVREVGDRKFEAIALYHLGKMADTLGDYPSAHNSYERSLSIFHEAGLRYGEVRVLAEMSLLAHHQEQDSRAWALGQQAIQLCHLLSERNILAKALTFTGHALLGLSEQEEEGGSLAAPPQQAAFANACCSRASVLADAGATYSQALDLRRELGQPNRALEAQAGLACVALAQGDPVRALGIVEDILAHAKTRPLQGANEPLRVYWSCYRVLQANDDPRAAGLLAAARRLLHEQAAQLTDPQLRCSFLENVAVHRQIQATE